MKTNTIITVSDLTSPASISFKDERLAKATQRITAIYNDAASYAEKKNREISKILADVADKKSYEKDGFKSVADYANSIFGIAKQNAYALASAGKVYNDETSHPELLAMTPSKLAEVSRLDTNVLNEALNSGKINHETTQKDLREFVNSNKTEADTEKPVVLDTYTVRPCTPLVTDEQDDTYKMPRTIDEWDQFFIDYVAHVSPNTPVEIVKLPKGKVDSIATKATLERRLYLNREYSLVIEFNKYVPSKEKTPKTKTPKFTREQLMAMLAEMDENSEQ